ncbi:metallophosphoesterase family protein [bacterium]
MKKRTSFLISILFLMVLFSSCGIFKGKVNRIIAVGHFYSIQNFPDIQEIFVEEMNKSNADAIVFMGDITAYGTMTDWKNFDEKILSKLKMKKYFVTGNHDLQRESGENAEENWMKNVGYTSKIVDLGFSELYLLNTVKGANMEYDWWRTIQGNGLDKDSIALLDEIPDTKDDKKLRFIFMHHNLDVIGIEGGVYDKYEYKSLEEFHEDKRRHSKIWNDKVRELTKGKISAIFGGDWSAFGPNAYAEVDGIPYYRNSFGTCPRFLTTAGSPLLSYNIIEVKDNSFNVIVKTLSLPYNSKWFYPRGYKEKEK